MVPMIHLNPVDLSVVAVIALVVLGPEKLPGALRAMGRLWGEMSRLRTGLESQVRSALGEDLPGAIGLGRSALASNVAASFLAPRAGGLPVPSRPSFNPMVQPAEELGPDDPCWN